MAGWGQAASGHTHPSDVPIVIRVGFAAKISIRFPGVIRPPDPGYLELLAEGIAAHSVAVLARNVRMGQSARRQSTSLSPEGDQQQICSHDGNI